MGRPRGSKNTAMVNGRITAEQMEWLEARAAELGGNLSAALRQTITDARLLELARADYLDLLDSDPDFAIPNKDSGASRTVHVVLATTARTMSDEEDLALRKIEEQQRED